MMMSFMYDDGPPNAAAELTCAAAVGVGGPVACWMCEIRQRIIARTRVTAPVPVCLNKLPSDSHLNTSDRKSAQKSPRDATLMPLGV